MNSDALLVVLIFASGALILIASTLGCVFLTKLMVGKLSCTGRTVVAALSGSLVVMLPMIWIALMENSFSSWEEAWGVMGFILFLCLVVAWLPAHFATRRLDRLTHSDIETFA